VVRLLRVPRSFQVKLPKANRDDGHTSDKGTWTSSHSGVEVIGERRYRSDDLSFRGTWTRRAPGARFDRKRLMRMTHQAVIVP
jgi:hypothetical protein